MITFETLVELQEHGARARARGAGWRENPFSRVAAMPRVFAQADHWREKREAWQFGWAIEDAYRTTFLTMQHLDAEVARLPCWSILAISR